MKRSFGFASLTTVASLGLAGLLFAACNNSDDDGYGYGGGGGGRSGGCSQYTTCGECTPVEGCGWCATPSGQGACAADPNECDNVSEFSWTWDPQGCYTPADAGVGPASPVDGGVVDSGNTVIPTQDAGRATTPDAAPSFDAGTPTPLDASVPDASPVSEDASGD